MGFCFLVGLEFAFGALHFKAGTLTSQATPPVHFALVFLDMGLKNYLPGLGWNCDADLNILKYDYRHD
jgi:hypothetical protein